MNLHLAVILLLPVVFAHHTSSGPAKHGVCKPSDGHWSEWSSFGPCSKTCGKNGVQKRYRYCHLPKYGGKPCTGDKIQVKPCEGYLECPVDGGWGTWKKGKCSKKCNGGVVTYQRHCNNPTPKHCGKACSGPHIRKEPCNKHHCPIDGGWSKLKCGKCFKSKKYTGKCFKKCVKKCVNPRPQYGGAKCVGKSVVYKRCDCHHNPCHKCRLNAEKFANKYGRPNFVGHACRVDQSYCVGKTNGIRDMYTANHWFFLHCSADGPWCKPCATRTLVYNPKCGQCETSRHGLCTGPEVWRNGKSKGDEMEVIDDLENDEELW